VVSLTPAISLPINELKWHHWRPYIQSNVFRLASRYHLIRAYPSNTMREEILDRFVSNLERVRNLVTIYGQVARPGAGRQAVGFIDILRAATVLLHASLEEVLRNIARWKFPLATDVVLDEIPLVGMPGRADRFLLGKLASHRAKSVQAVIDESVEAFLDTFTVNNVPEVTRFLTKVGIDPNTVNAEFGSLASLFERRHHIVHQADRNDQPGRGHHEAKGLNHETVEQWITSVDRFVRELLNRIPN
jgi:hypothetical protein